MDRPNTDRGEEARRAKVEAQRAAESRRATRRPAPAAFKVNVAGVSYRDGYPATVLSRQVGEHVELCPDPLGRRSGARHRHREAVAVVASGTVVGFLPRALADKVAPELAAGQRWKAKVTLVLDGEHPGLELGCWRAGARAAP